MHRRRTTRRVLAAVAAVALCASGAGCGGGNDDDASDRRSADEAAIRGLVEDLEAAAVAGDGARICTAIFTPKLAASVARAASSGSCAKEVESKLFSPQTTLAVRDVVVADATNAAVTVEEATGTTSKVLFAKQSGRWRIRSVQPA